VEASASLGCGIRCLIADECANALRATVISSALNDLDGLNLAALTEKLVQAILGVGGREVLDEKVALLLRVLEADLVAENLSLALVCGNGLLHIQLEAVHLLVVEVADRAVGCLAPVDGIAVLVKADEGEGTLHTVLLALLTHRSEALDVPIGAE
jgi:hypothetical protein